MQNWMNIENDIDVVLGENKVTTCGIWSTAKSAAPSKGLTNRVLISFLCLKLGGSEKMCLYFIIFSNNFLNVSFQ